jgi:ADP-ribosylglycohydrolase
MNEAAETIITGIKRGDSLGGPTALAEILNGSLSDCRCLDVDDVARRYLSWWRDDAFDTGPTFALVFERVDGGQSVEEAVAEIDQLLDGQTAGCGPAQRVAPLAAYETIPTAKIATFARSEARITHQHPHAGDAAAIVVLLCRYLIEGYAWEDAKRKTSENEPDVWTAVLGANLSSEGHALDTVRAAIHFLDGDEPLENSLAFAGDSNYCPVVVGAIENIRSA